MVRFIVSLLTLAAVTDRVAADYLREIKPTLEARCYACHGALKQKAGLRLDTAELIRQGGRSGTVIDIENPAESELMLRLNSTDLDERMPPEGEPLEPELIAAIQVWIRSGAVGPDSERPELDPSQHWAFHAPEAPTLPSLITENQAINPIDALIEDRLQREGLVAQPAASRDVLLRRVSLDLVGLPPTFAERRAFLNDPRPDAYERLVDRLLASPQYGERWGRHWMDIWRYTDWYGLGAQLRFSQKHIWHWRDWILESLNADRGYDQMVSEMIAGDELAPTDTQTLRATGFLARNYYLFNRNTWLDSTIEHTSRAFLGLTLQCARCHDHKYDPLSQVDYYRFRAFFEPHQIRLDPVPGVVDLERDGIPRAFDAHPDTPTYLFRRGNDKDPDETRPLTAAIPSLFKNQTQPITPAALPAEAYFPGLQPFVLRDHLAEGEKKLTEAASRHANVLTKHESVSADGAERELFDLELKAADLQLVAAKLRLPSLRAVHHADRVRNGLVPGEDSQAAIEQATLAQQRFRVAQAEAAVAQQQWKSKELKDEAQKKQDDAQKKLDAAEKSLRDLEQQIAKGTFVYSSLRPSLKALESPAETDASRRQPYSSQTTGRRTALARWMTDRQNPLTARVAVNHIWVRHFGQSFVPDVTDFGRRSQAPEMQAVLDYLAVYLTENQWRMKPLHRLIVTSAAYRRSSSTLQADPVTLERDPSNDFYWRRLPVRMESQVVRDSMRHLGGALDLTFGGPTVDPKPGDDVGRRSLYFTHSRDQQHPFLAMFDDAEILACYRRTESIIPQQALALINSQLAIDLANRVAREVSGQLDEDQQEAFVRSAFEHVLGVSPSADELKLCVSLLEASAAVENVTASPEEMVERGRRNLIQALFNHNDFVTIR